MNDEGEKWATTNLRLPYDDPEVLWRGQQGRETRKEGPWEEPVCDAFRSLSPTEGDLQSRNA